MLSLASSSLSSSFVSPKKYDVFLSFRGEDTRKKFTDHLYDALKRSGIITFRDDQRLEAGEAIAPELFKAIQESWCSIIVFSETYAFSGWCLDELAEIVKQKNEGGHKIFHIFYDVDPSDLRKQTGRVAEAFAKHEERYKENRDKTESWRSALTEVANLKGWHLNDRHESEFIGDIVKKILAKLCQTNSSHVLDDLIGISSRLEELHSKIDIGEDDIRIIGICGMGGIGKTTLAWVVYIQMSPHFEGKSFLSNVRADSEKFGLVSIQKQLLSDIFPEERFNFSDVREGCFMIGRRLSHKKVLVVIDDVDNMQQLKWLAGRRDWFGFGSRIIITTRDEHVLRSHRVDDVYKPIAFDDNEALRLFSLKAFNCNTPENDFIELSKRVVKYADGLPLALEVLGSFFCGRDAALWESAIGRLKRDSNKDIHERLRISFDGLEDTEQNIFLDIACFFEGEEKDFVVKILDGCEFFPDIGIDVLLKKSLIKVYQGKYLGMHDLIQEMGRKIVKEKSLHEPGKRCRLWEEMDVYHVLTNNTATEAIEGMDINIIKCREQRMVFNWNVDAFLKMKKLRLLRVSNLPEPRDDLKYLSKELRLLGWNHYPFRSLPSCFQPNNLVALLLPNSRIEQLWEGQMCLEKLKLVDLQGSENLIKTPDFSMAPNLESLILEGCIKMVDVHPSIGLLRELKLLNLRDCKSLRSLPTKLRVKSLERLILSGCSNLERLPDQIDGEMECLFELYLDRTGIRDLPFQIGHLRCLVLLYMQDCRNLASLPSSIYGLKFLKSLNLSGCSKLEHLPEILQPVESLRKLYLDGTGIRDLPSQIGHLRSVILLNLKDCINLATLPSSIYGLKCLNTLILSGCSKVEKLPEILQPVESLEELYLDGTGIRDLPSQIGHLRGLVFLYLNDCRNLVSLPSSIYGLKCLQTLILSGCSKLKNLPEILQPVESLEDLYLDGTGIRDLPSQIGHLRSLFKLYLHDCRNLASIPSSISELKCLKSLLLSGCSKLENLPESLQQVESLMWLDLSKTSITKPPSFIFELKNLRVLLFRGCKVMQRRSVNSLPLILPPLSSLTSLEDLDISYCSLCEGDIPSDICSLSSLEVLKLDGNKIISLPANLDRLSNLYHLGLDDCTELGSLPDLLTSTVTKELSLDRPRGGLFANATVSYSSYRASSVSLINCHRLGENTNGFTLLKKHLKAFAKATGQLDIILPGSEIPEWFSHQRDGYSIKIPFHPDNLNDSQCIGVALCCVCVNVDILHSKILFGIHGRKLGGLHIPWISLGLGPKFTKYHLWLCFWSRNTLKLETRHLTNLGYPSDELEVEAEFSHGTAHQRPLYEEVKKCGIQLVYERDLEEMENMGHLLQICKSNSATFEDIPQNADESKTGKGALVKRKRKIYEDEAGGPIE